MTQYDLASQNYCSLTKDFDLVEFLGTEMGGELASSRPRYLKSRLSFQKSIEIEPYKVPRLLPEGGAFPVVFSCVDILAKAARASGKAGGVAGVFAGVHN